MQKYLPPINHCSEALQEKNINMLSNLDSQKNCFCMFWMKYYLEVEDDCPNESKNDGRFPVHNIAGVDVHQLDLR